MSEVTVRYKVAFGRAAKRAEPEPPRPRPKPPSRLARMLALAHHVERLVEDGRLKDYAEAARMLGITRARISQVINLLGLSASNQEAILVGKTALSERKARRAVGEIAWAAQEAALGLGTSGREA